MKKESVPLNLAVPNHLGAKARDAVSEAINPLVADAFALYVKTKNYHWHLSGSHFRDYHLLFDEQADQLYAMIDILAERVRKLGGLTIHSIKEISKLQSVKDDDEKFVEPIVMIERLLDENNKFATRMLKAHKVCEEHQDFATTSVLETFIDEAQRRVWFLFETGRKI